MDEEQTEVEEVTTEDYETDTDSEGEAAERDSETGDSEDRTYTKAELDARIKEQDKRWKDRLKDSKKSSKESSKEEGGENYLRLDLKTEGVKEKKEQDIVLDYIKEKKLLGDEVTVEQALGKMVVKEALTEIRSKNVPAPSSRISGGKTDSYDYYAKNIKAGKLRLSDVQDATMRQRLMKGKIF